MTIAPHAELTHSDAEESVAHRDRILDALERIADDLSAEADAIEAGGRVTDRALALLDEVGIPKMLTAREFGGLGMYIGDTFPVLDRIGRIDGSTVWISALWTSVGPMLNQMRPELAHRLTAEGLPFLAASSSPTGRGIRTEGGWIFSGSYQYLSGGLHADYALCPGFALADGNDRTGPLRTFLVPRSALTHRGNWDTLGLRGTGSVDYSVDNHFVPDEMVLDLFGPPLSGGKEAQGGMLPSFHLMHSSFATGSTRRLLDEVASHADKPAKVPGAPRLADSPAFQSEYAEREMAARAARSLVAESWAELNRLLTAGEKIGRRHITLLYGASLHAHDIARDTAMWAFSRLGGTSLRRGPVQRVVRDTLAGCQHGLVVHDRLVGIGHELLGAPDHLVWSGPVLTSPATA